MVRLIKSFFWIFLILLFPCIHAQDYQAVYSHRIAYFQSYNINSLRIDSVEFNEDSIFHLVSNVEQIAYECYTPYGTSWIGKKIISTAEGMTIFLNKHSDTVRINGNAEVEDSWVAYEYPDSLKIIASVIKHDTGNFLGVTDSVKTIGFQAYDASDKKIIRPINDFTIKISKNYGLVKALNFSLFPNIITDGPYGDKLREFDLIGLSDPELGVQNLTWFEVHDFQPGDEIHVLDYYSTLLPPDPSSRNTTKTIKKYLNRTDYKDSIVYLVERIKSVEKDWLDSSKYFFLHDTIKSVIRSYPEFNSYPGEAVMGDANHYFYMYSMYHTDRTVKYHFNPLISFYLSGDSCWHLPIYDGCTGTTWYIKGLGGPYSTCQGWGISDSKEEVVYYMKADSVWGTPLEITGIEDEMPISEIDIYPNPARDWFKIKNLNASYRYTFELIDIRGNIVFRDLISNSAPVYLPQYLSGIYIYRISWEKGLRTGKLMIE